MKRFLLNLSFILLTIFSGMQAFMIKYSVIEKEEQLEKIYQEIVNNKREIHMLQAEWSLLNDPERLRALIKKQTAFEPIRPSQVISLSQVPQKVAPLPFKKPDKLKEKDVEK